MTKPKSVDSKLHPKSTGGTHEQAASVLAGTEAQGAAGAVCPEVDATVGSGVSSAVEDVGEGSGVTPSLPSDDVDLESLRVDFSVPVMDTTQLTVPCVSRPPKDRFFRILSFVWAAELAKCENCLPVYTVEHEVSGESHSETFLVHPQSQAFGELNNLGKCRQAIAVLGCVYRGSPFVWLVKTPTGVNKMADQWARTRLDVATAAQTQWLCPEADRSIGGYSYRTPVVDYGDPVWGISFDEAAKLAFRGKVVTNLEHPVCKDLLGL